MACLISPNLRANTLHMGLEGMYIQKSKIQDRHLSLGPNHKPVSTKYPGLIFSAKKMAKLYLLW